MVFVGEHSIKMMTRATPMTQETTVYVHIYEHGHYGNEKYFVHHFLDSPEIEAGTCEEAILS